MAYLKIKLKPELEINNNKYNFVESDISSLMFLLDKFMLYS